MSRATIAQPTDPGKAISAMAGVAWEPADVIEVRRLPARRSTWHRAADLADLAEKLSRENPAGNNLYVGINPRRAAGMRGDAAVDLARCLVADHDDTTIQQAAAARVAVGMPPPTLINASGHGVHEYWRLSSPVPAEFWRHWQKDLAALLGSDDSIHNPERVMRLPPFLNLKREPAVPCRIVECDPSRVYDLPDLPIPMRAGSDTPAPVFRFRRQPGAPGDVGDRVERCRRYLAKCPAAVAGQKGHVTTWHAANTANRFGLTKAEALAVMGEFSQRCLPPWSQKEIEHKVDDAYRRNAGQHAAKLREHDAGIPASSRRPVFALRQIAGAA